MSVFSVICGDLGRDLETNTFFVLIILIQFPLSLLISSLLAALHTDVPSNSHCHFYVALSVDLAGRYLGLAICKVGISQTHKHRMNKTGQ
jgi:hypothetical protein